MAQEQGTVVNVVIVDTGGEVAEDAPAGSTILHIYDAYAFNPAGGQFTVDESIVPITYISADVEEDIITLLDPLEAEILADTMLLVYPRGQEKVAMVELDDGDEGVRALIPFGMVDRFEEGIRDPGERESVLITDENGRWEIAAADDEIPRLDGNYFDRDTMPNPGIPTNPPLLSPDPTILAGSGVAVVKWDAIADAHEYDIHVSTTNSDLPGPGNLHTENAHSPTFISTMTPTGETPIPMDSDVWFAIVAKNNIGPAAPSAWVAGRAGPINKDILSGSLALIKNVVAELVETAGLNIGGQTWNSEDGLTIPGVLNFPPNNTLAALITAHLFARSLTVENFLQIRGEDNEISQGASVTLGDTTKSPATAPVVTSHWPIEEIVTDLEWTYLLAIDVDPTHPSGERYVAVDYDPTAVSGERYRVWEVFDQARTLLTTLPFFGDMSDFGGIARSTHEDGWYILHRGSDTPGQVGDWNLRKYNNDFSALLDRWDAVLKTSQIASTFPPRIAVDRSSAWDADRLYIVGASPTAATSLNCTIINIPAGLYGNDIDEERVNLAVNPNAAAGSGGAAGVAGISTVAIVARPVSMDSSEMNTSLFKATVTSSGNHIYANLLPSQATAPNQRWFVRMRVAFQPNVPGGLPLNGTPTVALAVSTWNGASYVGALNFDDGNPVLWGDETPDSGGWVYGTIHGYVNAPSSGVNSLQFEVNAMGPYVANSAFYFDEVMVEKVPAGTTGSRDYFDGDTADTPDWDYSWVGAANLVSKAVNPLAPKVVRAWAAIQFAWGGNRSPSGILVDFDLGIAWLTMRDTPGIYGYTHNFSDRLALADMPRAAGEAQIAATWGQGGDNLLFKTVNTSGRFRRYADSAWSSDHFWKYSYFDNEGVQHETTPSPAAGPVLSKGSYARIQLLPAQDTGDVNAPNSHRVYGSNGGINGTYRLQHETSAADDTIVILGDYDGSSGINPVLESTFETGETAAARIESSASDGQGAIIRLQGDGPGRTGPLAWGEDGRNLDGFEDPGTQAGTYSPSAAVGAGAPGALADLVFTAPQSGRAMLIMSVYMLSKTDGQATNAYIECREGNVLRNGEIVLPYTNGDGIGNYNARYVRLTAISLVDGLTPGAEYNAYPIVSCGAAGATWTLGKMRMAPIA